MFCLAENDGSAHRHGVIAIAAHAAHLVDEAWQHSESTRMRNLFSCQRHR